MRHEYFGKCRSAAGISTLDAVGRSLFVPRRADPAPDVGKDRLPDNYCPPHGIYMATQSAKPLYYAACRSEKAPC